VPIVTGLLGAWLGMFVLARSTVAMGPFRVQLVSTFGRGVTVVGLPPFGRLTADTHRAAIHFTATVREVDVRELTDTVRRGGIDRLVQEVREEALNQVYPFALRLFVSAILGAAALALLAFRTHWKAVALAVLSAFVAVAGCETVAWLTYRPAALLNPTFSGSLALAPRLIGPARTAIDRIDKFRAELTRIIDGATRVYTSIQESPIGQAEEFKVLHISDVHLSPLGMDFAQEVAAAFDVDLVVDTGDITSFGTPVEQLILSEIAAFRRPYVFVRGNHDSLEFQEAVRRIPNAVVLNGETKMVRGLSIYGRGDPVFTPDKNSAVDDEELAERVREAGPGILFDVTRLDQAPDIVAVHDDRMTDAVAGHVPLVISGHFHEPAARVLQGSLYLRVGSTGGAGANVFTEVGGVPLSAEVLYFSRERPRMLVAYDLIQQSPETGSLTVRRHVIEDEYGTLVPTPSPPSPSPTPTLSPTPT
jgi:predicted MPP superfamily phosphohydrolase